MQIQSSTRTRNGFENKTVAKVSDAIAGDTVFFDNKEEMNSLSHAMDAILNPLGLEVVVDKAKITKNGSYRTFIGDVNYTRPSTKME